MILVSLFSVLLEEIKTTKRDIYNCKVLNTAVSDRHWNTEMLSPPCRWCSIKQICPLFIIRTFIDDAFQRIAE